MKRKKLPFRKPQSQKKSDQPPGKLIYIGDEKHEPVINWKIKSAFPVKVQSSDLKSDGNEVAIETLEIAHEGLVMEAV